MSTLLSHYKWLKGTFSVKIEPKEGDPTLLTRVVVGSRLHGLATESSDWDLRGIHIHALKDVLSPFKTIKNTSWIEGDTDNTTYELADFCKQATHGNATILEVFFSNQVEETTPIADEMRANWRKFIDTDRFVMASKGYAHNQLTKMELFESVPESSGDRSAKFAVAYCRVMWQCAEFLRTGEFKCQIEEPWKSFLFEVKTNWSKRLVPALTTTFSSLQDDVAREWERAEKMTPDIDWIEDFLVRSYR